MRIIKSLLISAAAVYLTGAILPGVYINGFGAAIAAALILGILNLTVIPLLKFITFPLNLLTFGLISLLLNGLAIKMTSNLMNGFTIVGTGTGVIAAVIVSVIQSVLTGMFNDDERNLNGRGKGRRY